MKRSIISLALLSITSFLVAQSTYSVTSTNNDGPGSFRQAILDANGNANSLSGPDTISFSIEGTGPHTIQPTSPLPEITDPVVIDGYSQTGAAAATSSANAVLMIELDGTNAGTAYEACGLIISAGSSTVRGLAINRFFQYGIKLTTNGNNRIEGNFIGTDITGSQDLGNSQSGLWSQIDGDIIGGTSPEAGNLISGNGSRGIIISGNGTVVQGNLIGTDITGTQGLGNESTGIYIREHSDNCIIGGAEAGAGNVISDNSPGIFMNSHLGNTPSGHVIQGNFIGTDLTGTAPLGNSYNGITIADGTDILIGGSNSGEGNVIAFNGASGVTIVDGINNAIRSNSIYANGQIGINLGNDSYQVTPNDPGDEDTGPNDYQNFPELTAVTSDATSTTIEGSLNSKPNTSYIIDFFSNTSLDPSGFGEGETYLGALSITTDDGGEATFSTIFPVLVSQGSFVTSTATSLENNSSEFSEGILLSSTYEKPFVVGWNWFSVNVLNDDMSLANLLTCATEGDYIKNQTESATFYDGFGWFGSLEDAGGFDPETFYKIKATDPCGVSYNGITVNPSSTPINIVPGWNWIGYLPQCFVPVGDALASLNLQDEDYIKNQTESATYYSNYSWFGSLVDLTTGEGYMLNKATADVLIYPECPPATSRAKKATSEPKAVNDSSINPHQFEYSGSVTAAVYVNEVLAGGKDDLIIAFVDDQLRGVSGGFHFGPTDTYAYPIMVYSNVAHGEVLSFKYYNADSDQLYDCKEKLVFTEDMIEANAYDPFELHVNSTVGLEDKSSIHDPSLEVYPNPFTDQLHIKYTLVERAKVQVAMYDMLGKVVRILEEQILDPGTYNAKWNAEGYIDGIYVVKVTTQNSSMRKKVFLVR